MVRIFQSHILNIKKQIQASAGSVRNISEHSPRNVWSLNGSRREKYKKSGTIELLLLRVGFPLRIYKTQSSSRPLWSVGV